ncbi:MAG TPA: DHH family phosphoesterase, partial [Clostridia bacterium]|nr:DHH family phosphoesterase [Clostridia bacterium]
MGMIDIIQPIDRSDSIALITHMNPDGDAVGSLIALMRALDKMGKSVDAYCQDEVPGALNFLDGVARITRPIDPIKRYDLAIALDCSDRGRMGDCATIMDMATSSANIDHHISNTFYADINIVDGGASATGEMIYELVELLIDSADKGIAEALYTAIVSDTGGFAFSNTTAKTHRTAANLIEWGAETAK